MAHDNYAAGEFGLQLHNWSVERRFVVIRERLREHRASVGCKLIDVPGYTFRVFVASAAEAPEEIWRDYNRGADMKNRIAELKHFKAKWGRVWIHRESRRIYRGPTQELRDGDISGLISRSVTDL